MVEWGCIQLKSMGLYYTLGCNEEPFLFWRPYACLGLWYIFSLIMNIEIHFKLSPKYWFNSVKQYFFELFWYHKEVNLQLLNLFFSLQKGPQVHLLFLNFYSFPYTIWHYFLSDDLSFPCAALNRHISVLFTELCFKLWSQAVTLCSLFQNAALLFHFRTMISQFCCVKNCSALS